VVGLVVVEVAVVVVEGIPRRGTWVERRKRLGGVVNIRMVVVVVEHRMRLGGVLAYCVVDIRELVGVGDGGGGDVLPNLNVVVEGILYGEDIRVA